MSIFLMSWGGVGLGGIGRIVPSAKGVKTVIREIVTSNTNIFNLLE